MPARSEHYREMAKKRARDLLREQEEEEEREAIRPRIEI